MGCHVVLQAIPTQEVNPGLPLQVDLPSELPGKPMESKGIPKELFCFIDYAKAVDSVDLQQTVENS